MKQYKANIIKKTQQNENFRHVIHTGKHSQLVLMSIPPHGEIGLETHDRVEQVLFFLSGNGKGIVDGQEFTVEAGDVVVVPPGAEHNFTNTAPEPLKLYTVYSPPNHIDKRVHETKADADADHEDEAYGEFGR